VWFVDGSSLEGNSLTELKKEYDPYPREKVETWDWDGTNIRRESQHVPKYPDSIQYRVIQKLNEGDYTLIYDDDGKGEAADVVGIRAEENLINVELYHCKFSHEDLPGGRIVDLYEVCGQAQKSIHWMDRPTELINHLLRREPKREAGKEASRFEKGNRDDLFKIREMSRVRPMKVKIFIVQPGLSKSKMTVDQQQLLSVTENYLMETYNLEFGVIGNH